MTTYLSNYVTNRFISNCIDKASDLYQNSLEQLSSGTKFTSISEDLVASSRAINLQIQINANSNILSNIALGSDMLSSAESYQENIIENIQRINDLTLEAMNGTYTAEDKDSILTEIRARLEYINGVATGANFNGINILDGSETDINLYIGTGSQDFINIGSTFTDCHTDASALNIDLGTVTGQTWTDADMADYLDRLTAAEKTLTSNCSKIGGFINQIDNITSNIKNANIAITDYKSEISDTDIAAASAEAVQYQIMEQISTSIFVQANQAHQLAYSLLGTSS